MSILQEVQRASIKRAVPKMTTGHTVKVQQKIKEGNKERTQLFEGLIIKVNSGHGADKTVTVRKVVDGVGVEKIFPIYSPLFTFEVIKQAKVRRAKLYYMRDRSGKSARLKEQFVGTQEMEAFTPEEEPVVEEETPMEEVAQEEAVAEVVEETPVEEATAEKEEKKEE